jgi:hypothetical protein
MMKVPIFADSEGSAPRTEVRGFHLFGSNLIETLSGKTFMPAAKAHPPSVALLLTAVVFIGILTLPATPYGGDPVAWQGEARSILIRGELNVPSSLATNYGEPGQFFALNHKNGKYYSKYGTLNGILNVIPLLAGQFINNEVVALGIFAAVLSAIIGYVLYDLTGYYTAVEWVRVAFVLLCFYTTYAWNYLRCTSSEATQWLFFLLAIRSIVRLNRARREARYQLRTIAALWFWAGCLCLTKVSWVLLIPLLAGALIYLAHREGIPQSLWPELSWRTIILPVALICAAIAVNNWVKFGVPWLSGYHQWNDPNPRVDFMAAFYDLTLSPQWSFFICFPPLLLAIPGWKLFWRDHKEEGIFILAVLAVYLLTNILRGNWRGEWCYGPRYFLFILPVLALPAIHALEWTGQHIRRPGGYLTLGTVLAASLFFVAAQWQVNRLEWFFKYHVEGDLASLNDPQVREYFDHTHFAKISWDYWRARHDLTKIPYYARIRAGLSQEQMSNFLSGAQDLLSRPNLYWW